MITSHIIWCNGIVLIMWYTFFTGKRLHHICCSTFKLWNAGDISRQSRIGWKNLLLLAVVIADITGLVLMTNAKLGHGDLYIFCRIVGQLYIFLAPLLFSSFMELYSDILGYVSSLLEECNPKCSAELFTINSIVLDDVEPDQVFSVGMTNTLIHQAFDFTHEKSEEFVTCRLDKAKKFALATKEGAMALIKYFGPLIIIVTTILIISLLAPMINLLFKSTDEEVQFRIAFTIMNGANLMLLLEAPSSFKKEREHCLAVARRLQFHEERRKDQVCMKTYPV
ncbi:hypothetical protein SK128_011777 [Halocaridina rubra]|uniref:Uncharacterized protein n=1 Tax=Halocaridina rubra TaxID=373956 RepID=A0AAN8XD44_HALRR